MESLAVKDFAVEEGWLEMTKELRDRGYLSTSITSVNPAPLPTKLVREHIISSIFLVLTTRTLTFDIIIISA